LVGPVGGWKTIRLRVISAGPLLKKAGLWLLQPSWCMPHFNNADIARLASKGIVPGHPNYLARLEAEATSRTKRQHDDRVHGATLGRGFRLDTVWKTLEEVPDPDLKAALAVFRRVLPGVGRVERFTCGSAVRYVIFSLHGKQSVVAEARGRRVSRLI